MKLSRINDPLDLEPVFPVEVPDHPGYYYFPDDNRVMVSKSGQVLNRDTKLPRKLKVSFSSSEKDCGNSTVADLGFLAIKRTIKNILKFI